MEGSVETLIEELYKLHQLMGEPELNRKRRNQNLEKNIESGEDKKKRTVTKKISKRFKPP